MRQSNFSSDQSIIMGYVGLCISGAVLKFHFKPDLELFDTKRIQSIPKASPICFASARLNRFSAGIGDLPYKSIKLLMSGWVYLYQLFGGSISGLELSNQQA